MESGNKEEGEKLGHTLSDLLSRMGMQMTDLTFFSDMYMSLPNWASS